jgi:hypothetical protein
MTTKSVLKLVLFGLFAAAIANSPMPSQAQSTNTNKAAAKKTTAKSADTAKKEKQSSPVPFRGKLAKLDKIGKTLTVGSRTIRVTSETKITKSDKPATFEDGTENEPISGSIKKSDDGSWVAISVNYGPKAVSTDKKATDKKADKKAATPPKQ